eukprot:scaffold40070_cov37-Phaeocystis_antarctica.AAC.1
MSACEAGIGHGARSLTACFLPRCRFQGVVLPDREALVVHHPCHVQHVLPALRPPRLALRLHVEARLVDNDCPDQPLLTMRCGVPDRRGSLGSTAVVDVAEGVQGRQVRREHPLPGE